MISRVASRRILRAAFVAALAMVAQLALVSFAAASHYDFTDLDILTDGEREVLKKAGLTSTDEYILKVGKRAGRATVAKSTGLSEERLLEVARQCDLLRVNGLGPRMVKLFAAAEIRTIAILRKQSGSELNAKLQRINDEKHIAGLVPPAELIEAWIKQAQTMPLLLEE